MVGSKGAPFLALPSELIHHILCHLPLYDLLSISLVNHALYAHSQQDNLWHAFVQSEISGPAKRPPTIGTWRELYKQHHPYWFLVSNKIWFADTPHTGKLIMARYDHRINAIEAYTLVAERRQPSFQSWSYNPEAIIHTFNPRMRLDLNSPVVRLNEAAYASVTTTTRSYPRLQSEVPMDTASSSAPPGRQPAAIHATLLLTCPWPSAITTPATPVWPPLTLPSIQRTRNDTPPSGFHQPSSKPSTLSELCTSSFRLRKWMEFSARPLGVSMRVGEDITTFATLPHAAYTPTPQKPWQGIWCGDYAGHGCEFLVVRQLEPGEAGPLPARAEWALGGRQRGDSVSSAESWSTTQEEDGVPGDEENGGDGDGGDHSAQIASSEETSPVIALEDTTHESADNNHNGDDKDKSNREDGRPSVYTGRLEAIKLTGDPNIPRGEYTFIAPDIGPAGLLRIATEDVFKGARIVKSVGHIAARGFRDDDYMTSQLILISHDRLAQYWETFGHVSFYQRVDVEGFARV